MFSSVASYSGVMEKGFEIARGKTKTLHELVGQPDFAIMAQGDAITAGDGARRHELPGKGRLAALTTGRIFRLLNLCGLPTHYVRGGEDDDNNELLVRRCSMIPLEVVVRGVAAGSFAQRRPGIARGSLIVPRVIEFFLKDDEHHDPLIETDAVIAGGYANAGEVAAMTELARATFEVLAHAWRLRDVLLVDLKIEFGRIATGDGKGNLVIADVIDNDSWRIWPQGREELMLDKQRYRNLNDPSTDELNVVLQAYEKVAELVGTFPTMRPAMAAIICSEPDPALTEPVTRALAPFGLPMVRHVTSITRTPGHALSLIQQLEVAFPRMVFVAIGNADFAHFVTYATTAPVCHIALDVNQKACELLALQVAKTFALDDTVLYGRTMLWEGNVRSQILQADMRLNQPAPAQQLPTPA